MPSTIRARPPASASACPTTTVRSRVFVAEAFEGAPALAAGIDRGTEILAIGTSTADLKTVSAILAAGGADGGQQRDRARRTRGPHARCCGSRTRAAPATSASPRPIIELPAGLHPLRRQDHRRWRPQGRLHQSAHLHPHRRSGAARRLRADSGRRASPTSSSTCATMAAAWSRSPSCSATCSAATARPATCSTHRPSGPRKRSNNDDPLLHAAAPVDRADPDRLHRHRRHRLGERAGDQRACCPISTPTRR